MYPWSREILKFYAWPRGADMGCGREKIGKGTGIDSATRAADLKADMAKVPLPSASLDSIVSNHALEHAPDTPKVLKEWFRLLRPGRRVAVFVPDGDQVDTATLGDCTGDHRQLFTKATLAKYFVHAGFIVLDCARIAKVIFLVARKPKPVPHPK